MRGPKKHSYANLYALVLLWMAFELKLYVGGHPFGERVFESFNPFRSTSSAMPKTSETIVSPNTMNRKLDFDPTKHGHIGDEDVQRINLIQKLAPHDDHLKGLYTDLVGSNEFLNSKMGEAWGKTMPTLEGEDATKERNYFEKKSIIFEKLKQDKNLKELAHNLEQAENSYKLAFNHAWSRARRLVNKELVTEPEKVVEQFLTSDKELSILYWKSLSAKVDAKVEWEKMTLKSWVAAMKSKEGKVDLEKELKDYVELKKSIWVPPIADVKEMYHSSGEAIEPLKNSDADPTRASKIYEGLRQEVIKKTENLVKEKLGLPNHDIKNRDLNPSMLNFLDESAVGTEVSKQALVEVNKAYKKLQEQVGKEAASARDFLRQDGSFVQKKELLEDLFKLKWGAPPHFSSKEFQELWINARMIQIVKKMQHPGIAQEGDSLIDEATKNYWKAVRNAKRALRDDSWAAFSRSSPDPDAKKLIDDAPFSDSIALEELPNNAYKDGFERTAEEAKTQGIDAEFVLRNKISSMKEKARGSTYTPEDFENAAMREFIMEQAWFAGAPSPVASREFNNLRSLEKVAERSWNEKLPRARHFDENKEKTVQPMSIEDDHLLKSVSPSRSPEFKSLKMRLPDQENRVTSLTQDAYDEALKVAKENGDFRYYDAELNKELKERLQQRKGDIWFAIDEGFERQSLQKKYAGQIWTKLKSEKIDFGKNMKDFAGKMESLYMAEQELVKMRAQAIELAKGVKPKEPKKKKGIFSRILAAIRKLFSSKRQNKTAPASTTTTEPLKPEPVGQQTHGQPNHGPQNTQNTENSQRSTS